MNKCRTGISASLLTMTFVLTAVVLMMTTTSVVAAQPITVYVRADGYGGVNIFNAPGYTLYPGTVTEDGLTVGNQTAMGAAICYCHEHNINIDIVMCSIGIYLIKIGDLEINYNCWCYAVDDSMPGFGADLYDLYGGEKVHWFHYKDQNYYVLTTLDKTEINVDDYITARVTWKNLSGTFPLSGATVHVGRMGMFEPEEGPSVGTTDANGYCTFQWSSVGTWGAYAIDPVHGTGKYNWPPTTFICGAVVESCDESGVVKNCFQPGESVYIMGRLSASTTYNIWIQPDPVVEGSDLNASNDPSGSQETITTDAKGKFGLVKIWEIPTNASEADYDIVANNLDAIWGKDTYEAANDALDSASMPGFIVQESSIGGPTSAKETLHFSEVGSVSGEGFVMVDKDLLRGEMVFTEHGSGIYSSDEILDVYTTNVSISLEKDTNAEYNPSSFNFSGRYFTNFNSKWTQDICSKSKMLGAVMHKKIDEASYIKDETISEAGNYKSTMEFESFIVGATHIGTKSKNANTSEDYIGEFEISWAEKDECKYLFNWESVPGDDNDKLIAFLMANFDIHWVENATITKSCDDMTIYISMDNQSAVITLDDNKEKATLEIKDDDMITITYVLVVRTEDDKLNVYDCKSESLPKSVSGVGYVMVDKELSKGQMRIIEHGSGLYASDEDFSSDTLDKSTTAEYKPYSFNFSDSFTTNFSSKWMHSICTRDQKAGTAIHKKISHASSMADETTATISSMYFDAFFNGAIHIGVRTKAANISEDYIGVFNISEKSIEIIDKKETPQKEKKEDWLCSP